VIAKNEAPAFGIQGMEDLSPPTFSRRLPYPVEFYQNRIAPNTSSLRGSHCARTRKISSGLQKALEIGRRQRTGAQLTTGDAIILADVPPQLYETRRVPAALYLVMSYDAELSSTADADVETSRSQCFIVFVYVYAVYRKHNACNVAFF